MDVKKSQELKPTQFLIIDSEIFPNLFLVNFYDPQTQSHKHFVFVGKASKKQDITELKAYIKKLNQSNAHMVSFNGLRYDNYVIKAFLATPTIEAARKVNHEIIVEKKARFETSLFHHEIDVLGILDNKASLKEFQARIKYPTLLESPFPFDKPLAAGDIPKLIEYCQNDCLSTWTLFQEPATQSKYKIKLQASKEFKLPQIANKSESDIASDVMASRIKQALKVSSRKSIKELRGEPETNFIGHQIINSKIAFINSTLVKALEEAKAHHFGQGRKFFRALELGGLHINIGEGGLHTVKQQPAIILSSPEYKIYDYDVSSYYPSLILSEKVAIPGIENASLKVYENILKDRLAAKKAGDKAKADCYKIVLNSVFGKAGSKYSQFYNPKSMLTVTLNCQFRLLELVEKALELEIRILQVNTDGITILASENQHSQFNKEVELWQIATGFEMEAVEYETLVMKDVNNYVAKTKAGKIKTKGIFVDYANLFGGGKAIVIANAVNRYFLESIPVEKTVTECKEIFAFCFYSKRDQYIRPLPEIQPKVNRWIWAKKPQLDLLKAKQTKSDAKVENSENIKLANDISLVSREDVDIQRYIDEAKAFIAKIEHPEVKPEKKSKASNAEKPQTKFDFEGDEPQAEPDKPKELPANFKYPTKARLKNAVAYFQKLGIPTIAEFYNESGRAQPKFESWKKISKEESWKKSSDIVDKQPGTNLGIRLDDILVIDNDVPELSAFHFKGVTLPKTVLNHHTNNPDSIYKLEGKGHLIYKRPSWYTELKTIKIVNPSPKGDQKGTIIEIRSGTDKITIAPSTHRSGQPYKLENHDLFANLPELPKEFFDKFMAVKNQLNPLPKPKKTKPPSSKERKQIEEIKAQVTIYDVLELCNVKTQNSGGAEFIKCPWHDDKGRPNCQINPPDSKQPPCFCYVCDEGHDILDAYMAFRQVDFSTTLKYLQKIATKKLQSEAAREERVNQIGQASPEELQELIEQGTQEQIKNALANLTEQEIIFLQGVTGTSKSYTMLEAMLEKALNGQKCLLICITVENAETALAKFKAIQEKRSVSVTLDLLTAKHKSEVLEEDEETELTANYSKSYQKVNGGYQIKENTAQIIITTIGYVGRKGHTASSYLNFHAMIENRFIYIDEADIFFDKMKVSFPLLSRYLQEGSNYKKMLKCPVSAKKGDCSQCILGAYLKSPDKKTSERKFYMEFPKEAQEKFIARDDLGIASWESLLDMQSYVEVSGTLYYKPREPQENIFAKHLDLNEDGSYIGFLKHLTAYLHNPHIRIEYPKHKKEETPINPDDIVNMNKEQKTVVQFPVMACGIPTLCGVDLVPIKQLFGATINKTVGKGQNEREIEIECSGAKAIVFATATTQTMSEFFNILTQIIKANGWKARQTKITEIAFSFDVTLLKTIQHLSIDRVAKIILEVEKKTDNKILAVPARKSEADDLATELRYTIKEKVEYYYNREFEVEYKNRRGKSQAAIKVYLTYARSSIARGEDFPEANFLIVDCQQFVPFAAIAEIRPGMTSAEKRLKLIEDITRTLLQIIGRLLRSLLERIPGQTVKDLRKIVVLLHGLPDELLGFQVPLEVTHSQQEIIGTFISPEAKDMVSSCSEAILDALAGKKPKNYHEIAKSKATEKAAKEGQNTMSKKQRALLSKDEVEKLREITKAEKQARKLEAKFIELSNKVRKMARQKIPKREIARVLHLDRYPKLIDQLKNIYENELPCSKNKALVSTEL